jgi:hypothetical protein
MAPIRQKLYKLSAYTIAKNCSDLSDVLAGIEELNKYFEFMPKPSKTSYIRYYKLNILKNKFEKQLYQAK